MKLNDKLHGFSFFNKEEIPELSACLWQAEHEKSGAKLLFLEREDDNKTFAITFKTIPEDDTGVFHIIEHSVLCGSEKFPVKEPFVDLLKSSVKTFLNAFTFPDKTMYPVSSRCDKDFHNLIDVYMDAVLHPLAIKKPEIFMQEGWHYELHEGEEEMSYKGVVFNEMKGAYSSADEIECEYMTKLLYPDTAYGKDSGGNPEFIPTLTYEDFVSAHKKYYSPENSTVILDGSVELEDTLALLDSYLSEYERSGVRFDIQSQNKIGSARAEEKYEIAENESEEGKYRVTLGFAAYPCDKRKESLALAVAIDAISSSNEAPFKKAMLESGLMEDVYFSPYDGIMESSLILTMKNIREEDKEKAETLALSLIERIVNEGISKDALTASLGRMEFKIREQDGAGYPLGIAYAISLMELELYGKNPADGLRFEDNLRYLREKLAEDGYYESVLREIILESEHKATLILAPSSTLGAERSRAESARLNDALMKMSEEERLDIIKKTEALESWQMSEDTDESKATLPKLTLDDISPKPEELPTVSYKCGDNSVVFTEINSRGISYINVVFDASDLTGEELFYLSLFSELLENVDTKTLAACELQNELKLVFGSFSTSVFVSGKHGSPKIYFRLSFALLDSNKDKVYPLISEVLFGSDFSSYESISKIIKQLNISSREAFSSVGHVIALGRAGAYVSSEAAASDYVDGVESYKLLKKLCEEYKTPETLCGILDGLRERVLVRERATVFLAGESDEELPRKLLSLFPSGNKAGEFSIVPLGVRNEGIAIPARIAYSASVIPTKQEGSRPHGSYSVIRNLLSYGYLWNEIRVQGGAYGAGFVARPNGTVGFYSYRDPSPERSIDIYRSTAAHLRELAESKIGLTDYIISAVGDSDPIFTPKVIAATAFTSYLRGESYEDRVRHREQLLHTSGEDLLRAADALEKAAEVGAVCVVGEKEKLLACGGRLDTIIEL